VAEPFQTIRPRSNNLLVEPYKKPPVSEGGILIPETARHDPNKLLWKVLRVGPGQLTKKGIRGPMSCKEGDIILTERANVAQLLDNTKQTQYILNEDYVVGIRWRE